MHESIRLRIKHFLEHRATPAIAYLVPYQATLPSQQWATRD